MSTILKALEKVEEERRSEEPGASPALEPGPSESDGSGEPDAASLATPGEPFDPRAPRRRRSAIALGAGLAVLLALGWVWQTLSERSDTPRSTLAATKPEAARRTTRPSAAPGPRPVAVTKPASPPRAEVERALPSDPVAKAAPAVVPPEPVARAVPEARSPVSPPPAAPAPREARPAAPSRPVIAEPRRAPRQVAVVPPPPEVSVLRTVWHPTPGRRSARVEVEGHGDVLELREGDAVGVLVVAEIQPSGVVFLHGGARLRRAVGR